MQIAYPITPYLRRRFAGAKISTAAPILFVRSVCIVNAELSLASANRCFFLIYSVYANRHLLYLLLRVRKSQKSLLEYNIVYERESPYLFYIIILFRIGSSWPAAEHLLYCVILLLLHYFTIVIFYHHWLCRIGNLLYYYFTCWAKRP
jgi:hypothetical protein